jgi:hypothetical protein
MEASEFHVGYLQTGVPGLSPHAACTAVDLSPVIAADSTANAIEGAVKASVSSVFLVVMDGPQVGHR